MKYDYKATTTSLLLLKFWAMELSGRYYKTSRHLEKDIYIDIDIEI